MTFGMLEREHDHELLWAMRERKRERLRQKARKRLRRLRRRRARRERADGLSLLQRFLRALSTLVGQ